VPAKAYRDARWSQKGWQVLGGRKVNGAGSGFVEYRIPWPAGLRADEVAGATFLVEASAKRLLGKDRDTTAGPGGDYMRGGGLQDPGKNPNAYPMTGAVKYPSAVTVRANGELAGRVELADDPADSRGILSWHAQPKGDPKNRRLSEAGSYGELVRVTLPPAALARAARAGEVVVRLEVSDALPGGLAVYGREFGRYPLDPTVLFVLREGRTASRP
jgi:predicted transcriptional regulator